MNTNIPTAEQVCAAVGDLSYRQVHELARLSGVPFTTLWKLRIGKTDDPRIETVRKFLPHIDAAKEAA